MWPLKICDHEVEFICMEECVRESEDWRILYMVKKILNLKNEGDKDKKKVRVKDETEKK